MPTIPKAPIGQVAARLPGGQQSIQASPDAFGAGLARGMGTAADVLTDHAFKIKADDDKARAQEIDTAFRADVNDLLHNPETGYMLKSGKASYDGYADVAKQIEDLKSKYMGQATNDTQRAAVGRALSARAFSATDGAARQAGAQRNAWLASVNEASRQANIDDAVANYNDPALVAQSRAAMRQAVLDTAELQGRDPTETQEMLEASESDLHAAMVERIALANPEAARAYYLENKKHIDGRVQTKIEAKLDSEVRVAKAQIAADGYLASGMSQADAVADARARYSGKDEDEIVRRVKLRYAEIKAAEDQQKRELVESAEQALVSGQDPRTFPYEVREALGSKGMAGAMNYFSGSLNGIPVVTDWAVYDNLMASALSEDPKSRKWFANASLVEYFPNLHPTERAKLLKMRQAIRTGKGDKELVQGRTMATMVSTALKAAGYKTTDKKGAEAKNRFTQLLDQRLVAMGLTKEDPKWRDKVQTEVNGLMSEVVTDHGLLWDSKSKAFEIESVPGIPDAELPDLARILTDNGKDVTPANIIKLYELANGR